MKLRLKKLYIKRFIKNLLPNCKIIFDKESYIINNEIPTISVALQKQLFDEDFNEFTRQEFGISINYLLISILHEIGHYFTRDYFNQIHKEITMTNLYSEYENNRITLQELNQIYWRLPLEKNATEWGLNFYKNNKKLCEDFLKKMQY